MSEATQWQQWSRHPHAFDPSAPQAKLTELPMMTARRLSSGSKLAVECGLAMLRRHQIDAILYTSRHGEANAIIVFSMPRRRSRAISPTDFALSVHNSAVGSDHCRTAADRFLPLSAGRDTFQQGYAKSCACCRRAISGY